MWPTTTRAAVLARINAVPVGVIEYNQSKVNEYTEVRSDCSGLTWFYWTGTYAEGDGMWLGAPSTESMYRLGIIEEIPFSELEPGVTAIGYCGPGTANGGGGHIAPWLGYQDGTTPTARGSHHVRDHGSGMGPKDRWVKWDGKSTGWLHPDKLKAWRYVGIADTAPGGPEGITMFCKHGDTGPVVEAMQRLGLAAGGELPKFGPDNDYGDETARMLASLVGGDGKTYGPAEYAALMTKLAQLGAAPVDLGPLSDRVGKIETIFTSLGKVVTQHVADAITKLRITLPTG